MYIAHVPGSSTQLSFRIYYTKWNENMVSDHRINYIPDSRTQHAGASTNPNSKIRIVTLSGSIYTFCSHERIISAIFTCNLKKHDCPCV